MKRFISMILCLVLVLSLAMPVLAAEPKIIFTDGSNFNVGGTVTVDEYKTLESVYNNGKSEEFNAYYEGYVQYYWMRNDSYYADGPSITITESDKGCQFYCIAALYSNMDHTEQVGALYSDSFTVPNTGNPALYPEITTDALPDGVVGEEYYFQLECTDPDVTYDLFRSSLPDGLYLTQHGEIEGVPEKAGMWYVVIEATPEAGKNYACYAEFEFYINEAGESYTLEIVRLPDKLVYTAGEKLDMKGLWVRIYTSDGFIDSYDGKYLEYSQKALVTLGEQKIKISYKDAFEFFIVTVVAPAATEPVETTAPTESTEGTEAPEMTEATEATEGSKFPGKKPGKEPGKESGQQPSGDGTGDSSTTGSFGGLVGTLDITSIILIVLGFAAIGGVIVLIVVQGKKKKN